MPGPYSRGYVPPDDKEQARLCSCTSGGFRWYLLGNPTASVYSMSLLWLVAEINLH